MPQDVSAVPLPHGVSEIQATQYRSLLKSMVEALSGPPREWRKEFSQPDIKDFLLIAIQLGLQSKEAKNLQLVVGIQEPNLTIANGVIRLEGVVELLSVKGHNLGIRFKTGFYDNPYLELSNTPSEQPDTRVHTLRLVNEPQKIISVASPEDAMKLGGLTALIGKDRPVVWLNEMAYRQLSEPNRLFFDVIHEALQPKDPAQPPLLPREIQLVPNSMSAYVTPMNTVVLAVSAI